jgi:hypothetical protein
MVHLGCLVYLVLDASTRNHAKGALQVVDAATEEEFTTANTEDTENSLY